MTKHRPTVRSWNEETQGFSFYKKKLALFTMDIDDRRKLLEDEVSAGTSDRTETITFRGEAKSFPVITVNPNVPLLNHDNSRLSAQLEGHPQAALVHESPFSSEAQAVLASLLSRTEKFGTLKTELKDFGQQHPGVITREGVLINGNTRLAAMREIGADGFLVAVLPENANSEDFIEIEMDLQVRKLTHQDYTFTNELLLIDRYLKDHSDEDLFNRMGWQRGGLRKRQERERWLGLIREIRALSDPPIAYEYFDRSSEIIKNLDSKYEELKGLSISDAEEMKWLRITGMFVGANKDQIRALDNDFVEDELKKRVDARSERFLSQHSRPVDDDLGDLIDGSDEVLDLRSVASEIVKTALGEDGLLQDEALEEFAGLRTAIRRGADSVIDKEKLAKEVKAPSETLKEARMNFEDVVENLPYLYKEEGFDAKQFQYEADKVTRAMKRLSDELKRLADEDR